MYAKIYKEIFLKGYTLKKHLKGNIWVVKIENTDYYLYVYEDEEIAGFGTYNEAELLEFKNLKNTIKRILENKKFLKKLVAVKQNNSYLFKKSIKQISLFNYDNYLI